MTYCAHCGASGMPTVTLAGGVTVCHTCWKRQHDAGVTTCSKCRAGILSSATRHELNRRIVCGNCYMNDPGQTLYVSPAPPPLTTANTIWYDTSTNPFTDPFTAKAPDIVSTVCPDCEWEVKYDQYGFTQRFDLIIECTGCRDARIADEPVTEEDMDYVRRSLGVQS